jgi:hypothetical protein
VSAPAFRQLFLLPLSSSRVLTAYSRAVSRLCNTEDALERAKARVIENPASSGQSALQDHGDRVMEVLSALGCRTIMLKNLGSVTKNNEERQAVLLGLADYLS